MDGNEFSGEACDKAMKRNSISFFFTCESQKWVMRLCESILQTIVFLMPQFLTALYGYMNE